MEAVRTSAQSIPSPQDLPSPFDLLEPPGAPGFLRLSRPCCYVFPGGQGDCAFFAVDGFTLLVDGGSDPQPCFWKLVRHLERVDAVLMTHNGADGLTGVVSLLRRKVAELEEEPGHGNQRLISPEIGVVFFNAPQGDPKTLRGAGNSDSNLVALTLHCLDKLAIVPEPLCRPPSSHAHPITLFHKMGVGQLELYVLNPVRGSRELEAATRGWAGRGPGGPDQAKAPVGDIPLSCLASICALLVWRPASPQERTVRVLFPGCAPQGRVLEGLERLRHLDFLRRPAGTNPAHPERSNTELKRADGPAPAGKGAGGPGEKVGEKPKRGSPKTRRAKSAEDTGTKGGSSGVDGVKDVLPKIPQKVDKQSTEERTTAEKELLAAKPKKDVKCEGKKEMRADERKATLASGKEIRKAPLGTSAPQGKSGKGKKESVILRREVGNRGMKLKSDHRSSKDCSANDGAMLGEHTKELHTNKQRSKEQHTNDQHSKEQHANKQRSKEQHTNDQHSKEQPANEQHSKEQHTNDQHSKEQPTNEQHSKEQHTNDQHSKEQQNNEQCSNEQGPNKQQNEVDQAEGGEQRKMRDAESTVADSKETDQEEQNPMGMLTPAEEQKGAQDGEGDEEDDLGSLESFRSPECLHNPDATMESPCPLLRTSIGNDSMTFDLTPTEYKLLDGAFKDSPLKVGLEFGPPSNGTVRAPSYTRPTGFPKGNQPTDPAPPAPSTLTQEKRSSFLLLSPLRDLFPETFSAITPTRSLPAELGSPQSTEVDESLSVSLDQGLPLPCQSPNDQVLEPRQGMLLSMKAGTQNSRPPGDRPSMTLPPQTTPYAVDLCLVSPCEYKHFQAPQSHNAPAGQGHNHSDPASPEPANPHPAPDLDTPPGSEDCGLESDEDFLPQQSHDHATSCSSSLGISGVGLFAGDPPPAPIQDLPPLSPTPGACMADPEPQGRSALSSAVRPRKPHPSGKNPPKTRPVGDTPTTSHTAAPAHGHRTPTARPGTAGSVSSKASVGGGAWVYVDLAYVPSGPASSTVDAEFFRRVRSSYYILSGAEPGKEVVLRSILDALLEGKARWPGRAQVTVIPTFDSPVMLEWYQDTRERQEELGIVVLGSNSTVAMQDEVFPACKVEF
ncbi:hypothetical protein JZ751_014344 [Albula glossodonta]|uniref:Microtubule-associated protein 1A/B/S-like MBL-like domain-containing protein n=1 Tax=Albula glossodonta TaxID=121402 RepID=A0A8T2NR46_9TELE|nr:hypothetical protein JZ751_014344 [Albula glossodonta]